MIQEGTLVSYKIVYDEETHKRQMRQKFLEPGDYDAPWGGYASYTTRDAEYALSCAKKHEATFTTTQNMHFDNGVFPCKVFKMTVTVEEL